MLAYTGSTSSIFYFPESVETDTETYPIDYEILNAPILDGGENYKVQQGAGLEVSDKAYSCLTTVMSDFDDTKFYTPKTFENGYSARKILDYNLSAQAKSDFLARMSHEIRTPMNGIIGMTEIAFIQQIELKHTYFVGDELRINQVLANLLSNAVKYCKTNGHITLTVQESEAEDGKSSIYFAVEDDGVGIAKDKQALIFQRFEQADESEKARKQGTGLGLAISSQIVHMMNGHLSKPVDMAKLRKMLIKVL